MTCQKWGHIQEKCPIPGIPRYRFCVKNHLTSQHEYHLLGCSAPKGIAYPYGKAEAHCTNYGGNYFAKNNSCKRKRKAIEQAKVEHLWPAPGRPAKCPTSLLPPEDTDPAPPPPTYYQGSDHLPNHGCYSHLNC
jgi:hypothetical protein